MTSRLTVITGPPGVDIGPVAAHLGRDLNDGLAIRVVTPNTQPHTSPDPHHRIAGDGTHHAAAVRLDCLPSAWQDPQTNLGACYPAQPDTGLVEDLHTMDALGLNPAHRVTVQHSAARDAREHLILIPRPVEVGDLGVIARDSVLRAGGRVQIEAGDGQTFLQALSVVGIPPWADWIGHLDRWIVLDCEKLDLSTDLAADLPSIVARMVNRFDGSSGNYHNGQFLGGSTLRVALLNAQMLIPGIAGHDYNVATNEGDEPTEVAGLALAHLLDAIVDKTGVEVHLLGTGHIAGTGVWSWIDSGERA